MFWCLKFKHVKNSYLIRPSLKNSNFVWEMLFFFVLNMSAKNSEKFQPLGHFFELAHGKKLRFLWFGRKIKINRDLVGIQ